MVIRPDVNSVGCPIEKIAMMLFAAITSNEPITQPDPATLVNALAIKQEWVIEP